MPKKRGKRYRQALEIIQQAGDGPFALEEAAELVKKTALAKFDESVDIDVRLGVDPRHADQMVRGTVALPHGTGKKVRVLVLADEGRWKEALEAGADYAGLDEYIDQIQNGWLEFDVVIATPQVMSKISRLGRILGPRGLMPNPKSGTVTENVAEAVREVKAGRIDFRVDKTGNLHTAIGKASFTSQQIRENAEAFLREVLRLRPPSVKGAYVRSITLSTTMGPPVPVSLSVLNTLR
ncbi:ribosomal protein L1 [Rhodothermus marinus SG0.5JP17-172]|uniref:50S ribosomal protein L1 n=1 Tax=Rhodothermus marinus TaxID=29549 RepID=UPI000223D9FC|nr:50S ribosomal protein L1 [Rhodothermus marinus]AEN72980.1 ribosomal protein L1 [Rhodothermus marinus SG0.5JP17-172]MBO2492687.1 50S ribosomal protein L1 [Rhodothermus marinus]